MGTSRGLAAHYGVVPNVDIPQFYLSNDNNQAVALVKTRSLNGRFVAKHDVALDAVALGKRGHGRASFFGAPMINQTPGAFPAGVRRVVDGMDTDTVSDMFSEAANAPYSALGAASLHDGLSFQGGNSVEEKAEILLRAGIAAVLNADNPNVDYQFASAEIMFAVNFALASQDPGLIVFLASILDDANNAGCPLGNRP